MLYLLWELGIYCVKEVVIVDIVSWLRLVGIVVIEASCGCEFDVSATLLVSFHREVVGGS